MDGLGSAEGIVALVAAGTAFVALAVATLLALKLRRLRSNQQILLGPTDDRDVIEHAARLERGFLELRDWAEDTTVGIERRLAAAEERLDGSVARWALVRYDAYGERSGHQSSSLALLDAHQSGIVVSSIHHRDSARVYFKQVVTGESEVDLSPEEREAIERAAHGGATGGA